MKFGTRDARVYVEVHADVYGRLGDFDRYARAEAKRAGVFEHIDTGRFVAAVKEKRGVPVDVTKEAPGAEKRT